MAPGLIPSDLRVAFLGFALPADRFAQLAAADASMPIQTQRFGWAVIEALRSADIDVSIVSTDPVTDYPNNRQVLFKGRRFAAHGVNGTIVPFVNITALKHVTRFVAVVRALAARSRRSPIDAVIVHGVNSALLWAACRFGRRSQVPIVVLLTDPPSLRTPFDNRLTWQLKRLDRWLITSALSRTSGVVALAPRLAEDFASGRPALLMEGIASKLSTSADVSVPKLDRPFAHWRPRVVYAGGLSEAYGVLDLVNAVQHSDKDWCVEIYGRGAESEAIKAVAATSARVHYGGVLDSTELHRVYASADLLINPRRVDGLLPVYSFPSKLLEYMATGTPVMTTRIPTLPADYADHLLLTGQGAPALASSLDRFFDQPKGDRVQMGASAKNFILETRGHVAQGRRLRDFLEVVSGRQSTVGPRIAGDRGGDA